jgi:hypothetical protein
MADLHNFFLNLVLLLQQTRDQTLSKAVDLIQKFIWGRIFPFPRFVLAKAAQVTSAKVFVQFSISEMHDQHSFSWT